MAREAMAHQQSLLVAVAAVGVLTAQSHANRATYLPLTTLAALFLKRAQPLICPLIMAVMHLGQREGLVAPLVRLGLV